MRLDTSNILIYKGYRPLLDFVGVVTDGQWSFSEWTHADPQPTESQINAWAAEPGYADWLAEQGGNPTLTARRQASELYEKQYEPTAVALRAAHAELLERYNHLAGQLNLLLGWLDSQLTLTNRSALNGYTAAQPTLPTIKRSIKSKIGSGVGDT